MDNVEQVVQRIQTIHDDPILGPSLVGCSAVIACCLLWYYVYAARMLFIKPMRSTTVPIEARRKAHTKLSASVIIAFVGTSMLLPVTVGATTAYFVHEWAKHAVKPEIMPAEDVAEMASGLAVIGAFVSVVVTMAWYWRRPVRLFCPECGKYLPSDLPWICGRCNSENRPTSISTGILSSWRAVRYSYLYKCKRCGEGPVSYECHHCEHVFVIDERWEQAETAEVRRLAAYKLTGAPLGPESPERIRERHALQRERLEQNITIAELETKFAARKRELEQVQKSEKPLLTVHEKLEMSFQKDREESMAVHDIAREARAKANQKYAGDPEMLEMENAVIEQFVNRHGLT
jgi:hypothetical protein